MTTISPTFNRPQAEFLARPEKFRAFVGGFGSGKTWVGCGGIGRHFYEFPRVNSGYFAPSYPQIRDIFYPTVEESLFDWGLRTRVRVANHEVEVYRGRVFMGQILCRSMEDPGSIVGFKIGHALTDEIDTMPKDKATNAWRKIMARMRYKVDGLRNGVDVTTTPEGFRFVYEQFVKVPRSNAAAGGMYGLVHASTYDNEKNLPDDYIPSLLASYPPNLIDAYINGQFVNLQTGTVYQQFDRRKNACADVEQPGEVLFIGMDFNVGKMAAIIHVLRGGMPRAVDEIINAYDTPDMIRRIRERCWEFKGGQWEKTRQIRIYPDASGGSRRSVNASETDIALLKAAGFQVDAPDANPPVKDRINAMNGMFCNAVGERHYLVNVDRCPTYADCLEQQPWAPNGEPDKTLGLDHACFAGDTLVETPSGTVRIDALPPSGLIRGFNGEFVRYENAGRTGVAREVIRVDFSDGRSVVCTPEHEFLTLNGWVQAKDLLTITCFDWILNQTGGQSWSKLLARLNRFLTDFPIGSADSISNDLGSACIGRSMNSIMARSLLDSLSTTLMEIGQIIRSATSLFCRIAATPATTWTIQRGARDQGGPSSGPSPRLSNGMDQPRGGSGTRDTMLHRVPLSTRLFQWCALSAARTMKRRTSGATCSAPTRAKRHTERLQGSITRLEIALVVAGLSRPTNTSRSNTAPLPAGSKLRGVSAVRVSPAGEQDVFCLTVPGYGCFALHSGLVVSNCDAGGYFIHRKFPIIRKTAAFHAINF